MRVDGKIRNVRELLAFRLLLAVYLFLVICLMMGVNQAHAEVLLDDDFEDPAASSWNLGSKPGIRIVLDKAKAHSGNGVLEMQYDPNSEGPGFHVASIRSVDEYYHRWYQKWSANWVWSGISTKMVKVQAPVVPGGGYINSNVFVPWGTGDARAHIEIGNGAQLTGRTETSMDQNRSVVHFDNDRWYCIESHTKLNDPGTSNGIRRVWINDKLVIEYMNGRWRGDSPTDPVPSTLKFRGVMISGFYNKGGNTPNGVPHLQFSWHDDHVVSTQRIGCLPDVADKAAPSPPSGLRITGQ